MAGATGAAAVGAFVAPSLISGAAALAGFQASGVAAGSVAASWMSSIGSYLHLSSILILS